MGGSQAPFEFKDVLRAELDRRTKANPAYSLRSFAQFLNVDHSSLSKMLRGQIPMGKRIVNRLGGQLGFSQEELRKFTDDEYVSHQREYLEIAEDEFSIIQDWYHYAILCLTELENFKSHSKWISRALSISTDTAKTAVARLKKLGFLKTNAKGEWMDATEGRTTNLTHGESSRARREHQRQVLKGAMEALDNIEPKFRSQTSMTLTVNLDRLEEAKKRIEKFRREMLELMDSSNRPDEVYHLSVSLYPLTKFNLKE